MLWMFRFNPGKEQKTFPNHNPYTISRCKNCDIAKGKLSLARVFVPDNGLNVAKKVEIRRDNGATRIEYFLYSVNDIIE